MNLIIYIYKDLKKVKVGRNDPTPKGCVTDGYGNCYEIPKTGKSKAVTVGNYKFYYNYQRGELEMFFGNKYVTSEGLNAADFIDGPEYWAKYMMDNVM